MFWLVNSFPSSPVWYLRFFSLFKEKDDSGSGSHGSWLDLASDHRTCEWCSAPDDMRNHLPSYVKVPLDNWHKDLLLDLCYCFDCVQEYHRLQEDLDHDSKKVFMLHCSIDSTCTVHCIFAAMIRFRAQGGCLFETGCLFRTGHLFLFWETTECSKKKKNFNMVFIWKGTITETVIVTTIQWLFSYGEEIFIYFNAKSFNSVTYSM